MFLKPAEARVQFLALTVVWGASFLFVKVALRGISFPEVVGGRIVIGALVLNALRAVRRAPQVRGRLAWTHLAIVALLLCDLPFTLVAWSEQYISSGLASIYNAVTPLMTMMVSYTALRVEVPSRVPVTGVVLGFSGVLVLLEPWANSGWTDIVPQVAFLLATASYGAGFVYFQRFVVPLGYGALATATAQISAAALPMLALAPLVALHPMHLSVPVTTSVVLLGGLGTGVAYIWNANIIDAFGAVGASTVTYLLPIAGVVLGAALLHEHVVWHEAVGAAIVVAAIVVTQRRVRCAIADSPPASATTKERPDLDVPGS